MKFDHNRWKKEWDEVAKGVRDNSVLLRCGYECSRRPVIWPKNDKAERYCQAGNGLLWKFDEEENPFMRAIYARMIRDLPPNQHNDVTIGRGAI